MHRNFYGTLRVKEQGEGDQQVRRLLHGVILHGEQQTINASRLEPGTYYARTSGVGRAIEAKQTPGARSDWASSVSASARCLHMAVPVTSCGFTSSIPMCLRWRRPSFPI